MNEKIKTLGDFKNLNETPMVTPKDRVKLIEEAKKIETRPVKKFDSGLLEPQIYVNIVHINNLLLDNLDEKILKQSYKIYRYDENEEASQYIESCKSIWEKLLKDYASLGWNIKYIFTDYGDGLYIRIQFSLNKFNLFDKIYEWISSGLIWKHINGK